MNPASSSAPRYRLYYSPGACSLASHIALEELGVDYIAERLVIRDGGHRRPEYLRVNPRARVPALVIDETGGTWVLTESIAIMWYLANRHQGLELLPRFGSDGDEAAARALEWMSWLAANVHQAGTRAVIRPSSFTDEEAAQVAVADKGRKTVHAAFTDIEQRLGGTDWALGSRFSLVDAYLLVFYRWGGLCGFDMSAGFPNFRRVMDQVCARPSVARVIEEQGISIS